MSWKTLSLDSDLYTYEYFLSQYVCRICLCQNGEKDIAFIAATDVETKYSTTESVLQLMGIDLTLNAYPTKLCGSCWSEVENFCEFRSFCHETQRKLHDIYEKGSQDSKNEIPIEHDFESNDFSDIDLHNTFKNTQAETKDISNSYEEGSEFLDFELTNTINNLFDDLNTESEPRSRKSKKLKKKPDLDFFCLYKSCQYNLVCEESFSIHNKNIHGVENGLYKCFGCKKTFKSRKPCLRHELLFCKSLKNGYKCEICKSYVHKRSNFEKHIIAHERSQDIPEVLELSKCMKCGKVFKSEELLNEHLKLHGDDKKHWVCDTCGRIFLRHDYLYKHKLIHEGRKQHACTQCDFKTVQKSSLTVHIRTHTGERPFACTMCPQRCVNSSNLREHMRRHLGIKQFQCKLCDKKFGYKMSLEEHVASIHDSCSELHSCNDCGATYSRFRHLQRHLRTKHGKQLSKNKMANEKAENKMEKAFTKEIGLIEHTGFVS